APLDRLMAQSPMRQAFRSSMSEEGSTSDAKSATTGGVDTRPIARTPLPDSKLTMSRYALMKRDGGAFTLIAATTAGWECSDVSRIRAEGRPSASTSYSRDVNPTCLRYVARLGGRLESRGLSAETARAARSDAMKPASARLANRQRMFCVDCTKH